MWHIGINIYVFFFLLWVVSIFFLFRFGQKIREKQRTESKKKERKKQNEEKYESQQELAKSTTKLSAHSSMWLLCSHSLMLLLLLPLMPMLCSFFPSKYKDHKYLLLGFSDDVNSLRPGNKFWFSLFVPFIICSTVLYHDQCWLLTHTHTHHTSIYAYELTQSSMQRRQCDVVSCWFFL